MYFEFHFDFTGRFHTQEWRGEGRPVPGAPSPCMILKGFNEHIRFPFESHEKTVVFKHIFHFETYCHCPYCNNVYLSKPSPPTYSCVECAGKYLRFEQNWSDQFCTDIYVDMNSPDYKEALLYLELLEENPIRLLDMTVLATPYPWDFQHIA
jgi:hypothetical protein